MPNPVQNTQADPMTLTLAGGANVQLPANGNVVVNAAIEHITYHGLTYDLVGGWVVANNVQLSASYAGGQNIYLTTPQQSQVIYHYNGP